MSTPTLPSIQKGEFTRQPASVIGNGKTVRLVDAHLAPEAYPRNTKTSALAKKRLQEHLYDFHSRQIFSYAPSADEENQRDGKLDKQQKSLGSRDLLKLNATADANSGKPVASVPHRRSIDVPAMDTRQENCVLDGVSFMTSEHYAGIFEHDWRLSDADRVVRDAVERNRIYTILKSSYRVLLWFFRFYAGKSGLANGVAHVHDLFLILSKTKLLEDLNVQCVDSAMYAITDTPLKRDGMVAFLLNVAKMMSSHSANPARLRVLSAEGIEMSETMKTLVHDHFGVYSQIQDVNHFRYVFLRKTWVTSTSKQQPRHSRRLVELLNKHKVNLDNFFKESVKAPVAKEISGIGDQHQRVSMTFTQFLVTLRSLGLIASPKAATTAATTAAASVGNAPTGIEEGRALRIFLSCLRMSEFDCMDRDPGVSTRDATFEQFVEALLRIALMRKELSICQGGYDVCPGELTSELCQCESEGIKYDFDAFDDAVDELFMVIHAFRLQQAHKRAVVKMQSLRSLQLNEMRSTHLKLLATVESEDE